MKKRTIKTKRSKNVFIFAGIATLFIVGGWLLFSGDSKTPADTYSELTPVDSVSHIHGLSVDGTDSTKLYIATHHGLFLLRDEQDLFRIGKSRDDFMGFSPHPIDPNIFFASGHPANGGNLGVLKSEDQGKSWKKIASGASGPVDFHAMTVSRANLNILYGWYRNSLQRSIDGGETWKILDANGLANVISLATDSKEENKIYAGTMNGLFMSNNRGGSWSPSGLQNDAVIALVVHPQEPQEILAFLEKRGLMRSNDGGTTWSEMNADFGGDLVLHLAQSTANPQRLYAATQQNALYKSADTGTTWQRVR